MHSDICSLLNNTNDAICLSPCHMVFMFLRFTFSMLILSFCLFFVIWSYHVSCSAIYILSLDSIGFNFSSDMSTFSTFFTLLPVFQAFALHFPCLFRYMCLLSYDKCCMYETIVLSWQNLKTPSLQMRFIFFYGYRILWIKKIITLFFLSEYQWNKTKSNSSVRCYEMSYLKCQETCT